MKRIQLPSFGRRLLAFLIDFALVAGLTCFFYFVAFKNVVSNVQHFPELQETIKEERIKSKLYVKDGDSVIKITEADNNISSKNLLDNHVEVFYANYMNSKDSKYDKYWYQTHVLYLEDYQSKYKDETISKPSTIVYKWGNAEHTTYVLNDGITVDQEKNFARNICYNNSITLLNKTDPIKSINTRITWANTRAIFYSSVLGTIIPCLVIPLLTKNGKTVGKLCLHLIVLSDDGYEYKKYKLIFRYLALYGIEIVGAVLTIFLTFILTTGTTIFSRKKRSLHDFIAFSCVADERYTVFFKTREEEIKHSQLETSKK